MPDAFLQVKNNVKLVRRNVENLRTAVPKIGKFRAEEAAADIAHRMSKPGRKVTYPINWDSLKQKIRVIILIMKKQGFLPYVRTHSHERGWKVEKNARGAKTYNNVRGSKWLYGTMRSRRQSNIHIGNWLILRDIYDAVMNTLPKKVQESLRKVPKAHG